MFSYLTGIRKTLSSASTSWFFELNETPYSKQQQCMPKLNSSWVVSLWRRIRWSLALPIINRRASAFTRNVDSMLKNVDKADINFLKMRIHLPAERQNTLEIIVSICINELFNQNNEEHRNKDEINSCIMSAWHLINGRIIEAPSSHLENYAMPISAICQAMLDKRVHCVFPDEDTITIEKDAYVKLAKLFNLNLCITTTDGQSREVHSKHTNILLSTAPYLALNYLQSSLLFNRQTSGIRNNFLKITNMTNNKRTAYADSALFYDANYSLIDHVVTPYSLVSNETDESKREVVDKITARQFFNSYKYLAGFSVSSNDNRRYYSDLYNKNIIKTINASQPSLKFLMQRPDTDVLLEKITSILENSDLMLHVAKDKKPDDLLASLSGNYQVISVKSDQVLGELFRVSRLDGKRNISAVIVLGGVYEIRKTTQILHWLKVYQVKNYYRYFSLDEIEYNKIKTSPANLYTKHAIKKYKKMSDKERWMMINSDNQIESMLDFSSSRN